MKAERTRVGLLAVVAALLGTWHCSGSSFVVFPDLEGGTDGGPVESSSGGETDAASDSTLSDAGARDAGAGDAGATDTGTGESGTGDSGSGLLGKGQACATHAQCATDYCANGVCCDSACTGNCRACTKALTGQADGTCSDMTTGQPAPAGQCTPGPACGNSGLCGASGACELAPSGTTCGSPAACHDGMLTVGSVCDGDGGCPPGQTAPCPGDVICASSTACKTSCSADTDCQSQSDFCTNPECVAKKGPGGTCSANDQCTNGNCGTGSGTHCCAMAISPTMGTCAATDCDANGAFVFPGNSVALPSSQQPSGTCQRIVCNGAGGTAYADAPEGTTCTSSVRPDAGVCGDPKNLSLAGKCVECNTNVDCPGNSGTCSTLTGTCL